MEEAICEIITKTDKTHKFICDRRVKSAIEALGGVYKEDLPIQTPNELMMLDMSNIKVVLLQAAETTRGVCFSMKYTGGVVTTVFISEQLASKLVAGWNKRLDTDKYVTALVDDEMVIVNTKSLYSMSATKLHYKEEGDSNDNAVKSTPEGGRENKRPRKKQVHPKDGSKGNKPVHKSSEPIRKEERKAPQRKKKPLEINKPFLTGDMVRAKGECRCGFDDIVLIKRDANIAHCPECGATLFRDITNHVKFNAQTIDVCTNKYHVFSW